MREETYCAILRYDAMADRLQGIPEAAARQGAHDRKQFGARYLCHDDNGEYMWHPLLTIRFMVEVCGLSLSESRAAIAEHHQEATARMSEPTVPPEQQAREMFAQFGDVLEAREMAAFAADMVANQQVMAGFWRDVVHCIDTMTFVPEDTGLENW